MSKTWPQRGMTLIEMLVTLAIVAGLVALISQFMAQLYRLERRMESGNAAANAQWLAVEQLRAAIGAALPAARDSAEALSGNAQQLMLLTAEPLLATRSGLAMLSLSIVKDEQPGRVRLRVRVEQEGRTLGEWLAGSWAGEEAVFRYIDRKGGVQSQWPPTPSDQGTLPGQLVLVSADGKTVHWVAEFGVGRQALPTRRELVQ
jgi:prepilin-type N-terminal cleavage/methylation domain-containing protein